MSNYINNENTNVGYKREKKFPAKLWKLLSVNEMCQNTISSGIKWNKEGNNVIIETDQLRVYLQSEQNVFKTGYVPSVIRQLNLYGFKKINKNSFGLRVSKCHLYNHPYFKRENREMAVNISRKAATAVRNAAKAPKSRPPTGDKQKKVSESLQTARQHLTEALEQQFQNCQATTISNHNNNIETQPQDPFYELYNNIGATEVYIDEELLRENSHEDWVFQHWRSEEMWDLPVSIPTNQDNAKNVYTSPETDDFSSIADFETIYDSSVETGASTQERPLRTEVSYSENPLYESFFELSPNQPQSTGTVPDQHKQERRVPKILAKRPKVRTLCSTWERSLNFETLSDSTVEQSSSQSSTWVLTGSSTDPFLFESPIQTSGESYRASNNVTVEYNDQVHAARMSQTTTDSQSSQEVKPSSHRSRP